MREGVTEIMRYYFELTFSILIETHRKLIAIHNIIYIYFCPQEELDLTAVNKAAMMALPAAKKWQIYCSRRPPPGQVMPLATAPQVEEYIKALNEIADVSHPSSFKIVNDHLVEVLVTIKDHLTMSRPRTIMCRKEQGK